MDTIVPLTTNPQRRAAILARVSSDGQHVDVQVDQMRAQAARDGATLDRRHVYVDDGVSGKTGNLHARLDLLRMIEDLKERPRRWDVLYFFDFDRFARTADIEEQARILGPLQRAGVDLATRDGLQPSLSTSLGRMNAYMRLDGAADWLEKHKAQIKRGKDRAIAAGRKPAGPTPFGHTYDSQTKGEPWGVDPTAQAVLEEILRRIAAGEGSWTIAADLDVRGILRPRGGHWTRERVWQLARSRHLIGEWTCDKRRNLVIKVPPLVPIELWQAAQATLDGYGLAGKPRAKHIHLLEGIVRCGLCNGPVWVSSGATPAGRKPRPSYYACRDRIRRRWGEERCMLPMRQVADVDARVWARVAAWLATPALLEDTLRDRTTDAGRDASDWEGDLKTYQRQLVDLDARERQLVDRFARGDIAVSLLDATLQRNKDRRALLCRNIETARAQIADAAQDAEHAQIILATVATLRARIEDAAAEDRRDLVRLLIPGHGEHVATLLEDGRVRLGLLDLDAVAGVCTPAAAGCSTEPSTNQRNRPPIRLIA